MPAGDDAAARSGNGAPLVKDLSRLSQTTPVLTDTRGPFTFTVFDAGDANASCISGPGSTSVAMRTASGVTAPAAGKIDPSFQVHTARAGDAYSFVEGRAGDGVTAATLTLSDGSHVQTTIQNGWLVAWWPGSAQVTSAQRQHDHQRHWRPRWQDVDQRRRRRPQRRHHPDRPRRCGWRHQLLVGRHGLQRPGVRRDLAEQQRRLTPLHRGGCAKRGTPTPCRPLSCLT